MVKTWKIERVNTLKKELEQNQSYIFTDFRGLNVQQMSNLRRSLNEKGAKYHVVKNRFAKRVFNELDYHELKKFFDNPTAIAYSRGNLPEIAKILIGFTKETTLQLKGGFLEGKILSPEDIDSISKLPSREVLLAQVVGMMNSPIMGMVLVLNEIIGKFVRTLKAVEEKKKG